ncbi:hypothetical protein AC249_AIPGENE24682 [Exaiptasia diaphana]|nr:hypothetical protein AC249_AIPGENE24682 [Exaiptasia diaphana]
MCLDAVVLCLDVVAATSDHAVTGQDADVVDMYADMDVVARVAGSYVVLLDADGQGFEGPAERPSPNLDEVRVSRKYRLITAGPICDNVD